MCLDFLLNARHEFVEQRPRRIAFMPDNGTPIILIGHYMRVEIRQAEGRLACHPTLDLQ